MLFRSVTWVPAILLLAVQTMLDAPMAWGQRFSMKSGFLRSLPDERRASLTDE